MVQFYSQRREIPNAKKRITLSIIDLNIYGHGVAKLDGKVIFVIDALPGEQVEVEIIETKRHYALAKIINRLTTNPLRMVPQCRHYGICGGCQHQHIAVKLQRQSKLKALTSLVSRECGIKPPTAKLLFSSCYHYRRRARLALQYPISEKQLLMGFRQSSSNDLITINECPILCKELEVLLAPVRECLSNLKRANKLGHIELILADNGPVLLLRHLAPLPDEDTILLKKLANEYQLSVYLVGDEWQGLLIGHKPYYTIDQITLYFEPQGFIQSNAEVNKLMVEQAINWLDLQPTDSILDLFCGLGNFSLPIAKRVANVVAVEGVSLAVKQGKLNAAINGIENVQFYLGDLSSNIDNAEWRQQHFDKILLDPSREGALELMPQLIKFNAKRIVYVSCNPATFARDSKILLQAGYQIRELSMLDMFPQTKHLESIALFIKS